jgi:MFS transporter, FSR family, fosmidomycin resistance protein
MVEEQQRHIEEPRGGVTSNTLLYVLSLNHFVNDGSTYLLSSLFPAIVVAFGFSPLEIGVLVGVGYVVNMVFQPICGRLSERYEERLLLVLGISSMAVSMLLFTISPTFSMMLVAILILRFGSSFYHPVGLSVVSRNYGGARLDSSMGFQSSFGNLGIMVTFALSAPLYIALGWRGPFLIYAGVQFAIVIITMITMRGKMPQPVAIDEEKTRPKEEDRKNVIPVERRKYILGVPLFFVFATLVMGGSYAIFSNFGNLFLVQNGFGFSNANYMMAVWVGSAFFGAIVTGYLTRKLTRKRLLLITYFFAGVSSFFFAFSYHNIIFVLLSLLVSGFAEAITYPVIYSSVAAFVNENPGLSRGTAFGIIFSAQIGGSALFGVITGYIADAYNLQLPFVIGAVLLLVYTVVVYFSQH